MLNVLDEFTHECLAIIINRKLKAIDVINVLSDLFILRGFPGHIRQSWSNWRSGQPTCATTSFECVLLTET